jgi:polar amino acid transport system substrate-binding protein
MRGDQLFSPVTRMRSQAYRTGRGVASPCVLARALSLFAAVFAAAAAEDGPGEPLRVAVYDVASYGSTSPDGRFVGISVELWRRVAEDLHLPYRFTLVPHMEEVLAGLEVGRYDAAIGAITITPERLARVDFSYPAHRSGVAVAFSRPTGPLAALQAYGAIARDLGSLILLALVLVLLIGFLMWAFERRRKHAPDRAESAVTSLHEGIYWAVVTMTTVGYGDKTPKTPAGRVIAVSWMLGSLALVSLLSTSLIAQMTAERVDASQIPRDSDLEGKRLAAAGESSGAEYLDGLRFKYTPYADLQDALASLANGKSDAVVNSVGALQYAISSRFSGAVSMPRGLLAPSYMAFALPPRSPLKRALDPAMIRITASADWRSVEESYFGK